MPEPMYKVGDKFVLTIDAVDESFGCVNYKASGLTFSPAGLDRFERYDEAEITRRFIERRIEELRKQIEAFERERDAICDAIRAIDGTHEK